eukprot:1144949-Pelagomonas_calceolata.AAC.2
MANKKQPPASTKGQHTLSLHSATQTSRVSGTPTQCMPSRWSRHTNIQEKWNTHTVHAIQVAQEATWSIHHKATQIKLAFSNIHIPEKAVRPQSRCHPGVAGQGTCKEQLADLGYKLPVDCYRCAAIIVEPTAITSSLVGIQVHTTSLHPRVCKQWTMKSWHHSGLHPVHAVDYIREDL